MREEVDSRRQIAKSARLAADNKYECSICKKIDEQSKGIVIAYAGNILLAVCPDCMTAPIVIQKEDHGIRVGMLTPRPQGNIQVAKSMREVHGMQLAKPQVEKVSL